MKPPIDAYGLRANFIPAVAAFAAPLAFVGSFITWSHLHVSQLLAPLLLSLFLTIFADFASRKGRVIQQPLFEEWGGMPAVALLRHSDTRTHHLTKMRRADFLMGRLSERRPTEEEERSNPADADAAYERCIVWLREHTRDTKAFHILFEKLTTYGLRRNLLGLRPIAFTAILVTVPVAIVVTAIRYYRNPDHDLSAVVIVLAAAALQGIYFFSMVDKQGVKEAADAYATHLLNCTEHFISSPPAQTKKSSSTTTRNRRTSRSSE